MARLLLPKKLLQIVRRPICVEMHDGGSATPRRFYFDDTLRLGYGEDCEIRLDGEGGPRIVCGLQRTRGPLRLWRARRREDEVDDHLALEVDGHAVEGGGADVGPGSRIEVLDRDSGRRYRLHVQPPARWWLRPRALLAIVAVLSVAGAIYGGYVYRGLSDARRQIGMAEQRLRQTELGVEQARSGLADVERRIAATEIGVAAAVNELRDAQAVSEGAIRGEFDRRLEEVTARTRDELERLGERDLAARARLQAEARAEVETLRRELSDRMVDAYREFKRVETRLYKSLGERLQAVEPPGVRFKRVFADSRGAVVFVRTSYELRYRRTDEVSRLESFGTGFLVRPAGAGDDAAAALLLTAQHVLYPWRFDRALQVLVRLGLVELSEGGVEWDVWTTGAEVMREDAGADGHHYVLDQAWRSAGDERALRLLYVAPLVTAEEVVQSPVGMVPIQMPVAGAGDVAVLKLMDFDAPPAALALAALPSEPLDEALAVGYPLSRLEDGRAEPQAVIGFVRRQAGDILELNTALNPGLSGGPVLDREGDVVGMAIGIVDTGAYGLAVAAEALAAAIDAAAAGVLAEERRLRDAGCDPGPVDGVFDAATWAANRCEKARDARSGGR